jgi:hypothetical protein
MSGQYLNPQARQTLISFLDVPQPLGRLGADNVADAPKVLAEACPHCGPLPT